MAKASTGTLPEISRRNSRPSTPLDQLIVALGALGLAQFGSRSRGGFGGGALEVQREEFFEDLLIGQVGGPAVGGGDCGIELPVREVEPGGAL